MKSKSAKLLFLTNFSLQKKITLLVFFCLILGLSLFSWLGVRSVNENTERTLDERLTMARIVASHLNEELYNLLVQVENAADFISSPPSEWEFQQKSEALTVLLSKLLIVTRGVFLLDNDGKMVQGAVLEAGTAQLAAIRDPSSFDGVSLPVTPDSPAISDLVSLPYFDEPVALATVPVWDPASRPIGWLSVAFDVGTSSISGFIKPITLGETGYAELVDRNGIVLARTEPGTPPKAFEVSDHPGRFAQLVAAGKATVRTCHVHHEAVDLPQTTPPKQKDILAFVPLSAVNDGGRTVSQWGVAVRQSEEEAFGMTNQLKRRLLTLGGIVLVGVFLLMWLVMQRIVRPIKVLTIAAARVAKGDFGTVIPFHGQDEIGQLGDAFSAMTRNLDRSQQELVSRNRDLSALNSIAATVSQSLDLQDVLAKATQKVLEITGSQAGCVLILDRNSKILAPASQVGPSSLIDCRRPQSAGGHCSCYDVLRTGHTQLVNDPSQCPMLANKTTGPLPPVCFVSIPLISKEKSLGVMNIACSNREYFTEHDLRLLDSIGRHVGLAMENAILYEDARQKEVLRGHLLNSVITAQEDERKRISRELHDGLGQTLAGLIMGIESAETMASTDKADLGAKLADTREVAAAALGDMRKLLQDLRPPALDDLGLAATIRSYAESRLETAGIRLEFQAEGLDHHLPSAVETAIFRIVQEAVHNVIRHAQAHTAWVQLKGDDNKITVIVRDDGRGFDSSAFLSQAGTTQSLGLISMRERATLLGGSFAVNSRKGQGAEIVVEIPVAIESIGGTKDEQQDARVDS